MGLHTLFSLAQSIDFTNDTFRDWSWDGDVIGISLACHIFPGNILEIIW